MGVSATVHGSVLLALGYSVDQVVHDYGDLCQANTDLAVERDAPFSVDEFRTLNRCLDNAIADAVTEFSYQRDTLVEERHSSDLNEQFGYLLHDLRNSLNVATLSVLAMETGILSIKGATGSVLKRSLSSIEKLISQSLGEVRRKGGAQDRAQKFALGLFIAEAYQNAQLDANARGCILSISPVDSLLGLEGNREKLLAALANLLNNAFKFTCPNSEVILEAYATGDRISIDVTDHCGGPPEGDAEKLFSPFCQRGDDKSGLGLGSRSLGKVLWRTKGGSR